MNSSHLNLDGWKMSFQHFHGFILNKNPSGPKPRCAKGEVVVLNLPRKLPGFGEYIPFFPVIFVFFLKQGNPTFCSFSLTKYVRIRKPHPFFPFALGMMVPSHLRWTNKTTLPKSRKTFKLIPILRVQPCQPPPMPQISDTLWMEHRGFAHGKTWEKLVFVSDVWNSHGNCKVVWL